MECPPTANPMNHSHCGQALTEVLLGLVVLIPLLWGISTILPKGWRHHTCAVEAFEKTRLRLESPKRMFPNFRFTETELELKGKMWCPDGTLHTVILQKLSE